jgi:hypothetical protein
MKKAICFGRLLVPALVLAAGSSMSYAQCTGFNITSSTGASIVPGTTDTGNHTDDSPLTTVNLPFSVTLYGVGYSTVQVGSNGNLQFTSAGSNLTGYDNNCLSAPDQITGVAMFPHWDDLRTDGTNGGVFTSVSGVAPNRIFNIEWRAIYYNTTTTLNFEVRLYENNSKVEYIYGSVPQSGASATVGIQNATGLANQYECNTGGLANGMKLTLTPINSATVLCMSGGASPAAVNNCSGAPVMLTAQVTPGVSPASTGITVTANLSSIGGAAAQQMFDNGTNGDVTPGDNTYSYIATVPSTVGAGLKSVAFSSSDQQGRTGTASATVNVNCVAAPNPTLGPDVVTFNITDVPNWGTSVNGAITAYSVGTTSSNEGDYPVLWMNDSSYMPDYDNTHHPVISQNMYRLKDYGGYKRFEQLGQSWLKHGFTSTNSPGPNGCTQPQVWRQSTLSYQSVGGDALGINCTDTYGGGLNGSQGLLGPKNAVNATTGFSPFIQGTGTDTGNPNTNERLQVPTADVTGQPAGTRFFVDAYYVTQDDAQFVRPGQTVAFNSMNNASWREIRPTTITSSPAFTTASDYPPTAGATLPAPAVVGTRLHDPGIFAWAATDAGVVLVSADHDDAPNPGFPGKFVRSRYWMAARVTPLAGGLYRYEYAVYNHNSDRSGQKFRVPMPVSATVSNVSFHAPAWHSGEPYSNAAWTSARSNTDLSFATQTYATNQNANALRWGNTFNFGFTCNVAPAGLPVTLDLFKPGTVGSPSSVSANSAAPALPPRCGLADLGSQGGLVGSDNVVDNNDFVVFIDLFFSADGRADFGKQGGLPGADGAFDNNDFVVFIDQFFAGC